MMMGQSRRATTVLSLLILLASGCTGATTASLTPSATTTTAIQGWERWLSVDLAPQTRGPGNDLEGYVYSHYGQTIVNVQLLAQGLDASGNVVGQKVEWVQQHVPGLQRVYFRIHGMPAAARYRVSVWAFDTIESNSWL